MKDTRQASTTITSSLLCDVNQLVNSAYFQFDEIAASFLPSVITLTAAS